MKFKFSLIIGVVISILSLIPGDRLPQSDIKYADLAVHVVMYFVWLMVINFELKRQFSNHLKRYLYVASLILFVFGGIIEILQEQYIQGRFGSWSDFIANGFGSVLGLIIASSFLNSVKNK